jgi:hypothetical protein
MSFIKDSMTFNMKISSWKECPFLNYYQEWLSLMKILKDILTIKRKLKPQLGNQRVQLNNISVCNQKSFKLIVTNNKQAIRS